MPFTAQRLRVVLLSMALTLLGCAGLNVIAGDQRQEWGLIGFSVGLLAVEIGLDRAVTFWRMGALLALAAGVGWIVYGALICFGAGAPAPALPAIILAVLGGWVAFYGEGRLE
jgi:hypothetical protein